MFKLSTDWIFIRKEILLMLTLKKIVWIINEHHYEVFHFPKVFVQLILQKRVSFMPSNEGGIQIAVAS